MEKSSPVEILSDEEKGGLLRELSEQEELLELLQGYKISDDVGGKKKKMIVKKGDKIKVQYEGSTTADGKVFDASKPESPLAFTVGAGMMIKGFDKGVEGMKLGEEKTVSFKCEEGYGARDEKRMMKFKKDFFPKELKIEKGMTVPLQDQGGNVHRAVVAEVTEEGATLDLNHFLAGKDLTFKIKIESIE